MPPPGAFEQLQQLINDISVKEGSPAFQPHITLLSVPYSAQITENPESIIPPRVSLPKPFAVNFNKVCAGRSYFQSVLVELVPGDAESPLRTLYDATLKQNESYFREKGGDAAVRAKQNFYPHVSLYYGDRTEAEREKIIAELVEEGSIDQSQPVLTVAGVKGGFDVNEIWVVNCEGPIEGWQIIHKIEL